LIGGHQQGHAELAQQGRQRARVFVADFARGRSAGLFRRCGAGVGALPRGLDFNPCHGIPLCLWVGAVVCFPMVTATSSQAMPVWSTKKMGTQIRSMKNILE